MSSNRFTLKDLDIKGMKEISPGVYQKVSSPQPREIKKGKKPHKEVQEDIANIPWRNTLHITTSIKLVFNWADKHVSLNDWYSSKHWSHRNKIQKEWHAFFKSYLIAPYPQYKQYKIELMYNSRLDPSNTIPMIKLCEDMLTENGIIPNDTKEFCKGIVIVPNEIMKKFSYQLIIHNIL